MKTRHSGIRALVAGLFALQAIAASAQIVIGQTADFNGQAGAYVREARLGATLYFDAINEQGGIHGQKIELVSIDDAADPQRSAANARTLLDGWNALALFLSHGTGTSQSAARAAVPFKAALVGPSSGAHGLRQPVLPNVFNVRASHRRELQQAMRSLQRVGMERSAVLQSADAFGDDAAAGVGDAALPQPPLHERFDPAQADFAALAARVVAHAPQVIYVIADTEATVAAIRALRAAGSRAQVVTLSNNASPRFIELLGPLARGVGVTQLFPYERSIVSPLVKRAMDVGRSRGVHGLTPPLMEGFAAAQVMVEALRRAGPRPEREKLVGVLNGLQRFDIGGVLIDYSPTDHSGTAFTDISVISALGRFQR